MPICNPEAIYCTEAQMPRSDQCLTPCEGVYADITHENLDIIDINTPGLKNVKPNFTMSESHSIHQHLTSYKRF